MNNFYQEWRAYQLKYSLSHEVLCRVPLVGYFAWREGDIFRCEPSQEASVRGDRRMGSIWVASKDDLAALDFSTEKATCTLFAIPFSGLHNEKELELMYGNGKGSFVAYYDSGLTPRAANTPSGYSVKSSMPKGYKFAVEKCPKCQRPVKENWLVKHIKSGCTVPATNKSASR